MERRFWVNDYREKNPRDTVNGNRLVALVHDESCQRIPRNHRDEWMQFDTLEAAEAHFGVATATCFHCLEGQGTHLDRVQRR